MMSPRILLVAEEGLNAKDIQGMLTGLGYTVVAVACSGAQAIQETARGDPALVLMGIRLKGELDGVATAAPISAAFDIPVVFLTAYADEGTVQRAKLTKPYGYVLNPFDPMGLRATIEIALYKHQVDRASKENLLRLDNSDAVIITDALSLVTFMNPVAETLTGWLQADALNNALTAVFHTRDRADDPPTERLSTKALRADRVVISQQGMTLLTKEGTDLPIANHRITLRDRQGHFTNTIVVFYESAEPPPGEPVLDQRLQRVLYFIERHADQRITLEALASQACLSSDRLRHLFKEVFHLSLRDHCAHVRIEKAKNLLADFNLTILDIAGRVGYSAQRNFARDFKKLTQQTPSQFRKDFSKLFSNPPASTRNAR